MIGKNYWLSPAQVLAHLEKLPTVLAVAETGSIHAASRALHLAQPSVSVKLKTLEQVLGAALFRRTSTGVRPTREGMLVVDLARRIERGAADLCAQLKAPPGALAGALRVGIYDSIARYLWPRFYRTFAERFPSVALPVSTARSVELVERLKAGALDLVLSIEPPRHRRLEVVELFTDRFSLYAHRRFLAQRGVASRARRAWVRKEAIAALPLYVFTDAVGEHGKNLVEVFGPVGASSRAACDVASFEVALEFCSEQMGLAVLPNQVALALHERGALVKVSVEGQVTVDFGPHRICASTLRERADEGVVRAVVQHLRDVIAARRPGTGGSPGSG